MGTGPAAEASAAFRADRRLYVVIGLFTSFFAVLFLFVTIKRPERWPILAGVCGATVALFLCPSRLRLEITPDTFHYRNLSTSRTEKFSDIDRAYFQTIHSTHTPGGVAAFWIRPKQGKPVKVNLRTFPIEAAAVLFAALDEHGIPIDVPDTWAARRMARQIRECQAKLHPGGK